MRHLLQSLIMSIAVIGIASPSFAGDDREDNKWDRDKKEQSYHNRKDKDHHNVPSGKPFKKLIMIVEALDKRVTALEEENAELAARLACLSGESDAYNVFFEGCNVHVRNGVGITASMNERGNLIVGYNEYHETTGTNDRTGSHNLVVGPGHSYASYGGFVTGLQNTVSGIFASVSGGTGNTASANWSSISGGQFNHTEGWTSSISGGVFNRTENVYGTVSGGDNNTASGYLSHVSGGFKNNASGLTSTVSGGSNNVASGDYSTVGGGQSVECIAEYGWAAGTTADTCP